ncbi:MAG: hypothetical protein HY721_03470 [Planctomycetes bacterium]|nr:hypothetical protein [Planctomycetota bacterium]
MLRVLVVTLGVVAGASWSFDADKPGEAAKGFTAEVGEWKVEADAEAPSKPHVLAQRAKSAGPVFNVALAAESKLKDLEVSVKLKAVAGETDQGGGVVWRAKDAKNYYVARHNPLEDNFRVYKVVGGKRTQLGSADVDVPGGWHDLKVVMVGDKIECSFDGKKHLEVKDGTFAEAGKVGLWTKADAQTRFDDFAAKAKE